MANEKQFSVILKRLEENGWDLMRIKGNHRVFTGTGRQALSIPVRGKMVKAFYDKKIDKAIRDLQRREEEG